MATAVQRAKLVIDNLWDDDLDASVIIPAIEEYLNVVGQGTSNADLATMFLAKTKQLIRQRMRANGERRKAAAVRAEVNQAGEDAANKLP
jgi:hypothetical protein